MARRMLNFGSTQVELVPGCLPAQHICLNLSLGQLKSPVRAQGGPFAPWPQLAHGPMRASREIAGGKTSTELPAGEGSCSICFILEKKIGVPFQIVRAFGFCISFSDTSQGF